MQYRGSLCSAAITVLSPNFSCIDHALQRCTKTTHLQPFKLFFCYCARTLFECDGHKGILALLYLTVLADWPVHQFWCWQTFHYSQSSLVGKYPCHLTTVNSIDLLLIGNSNEIFQLPFLTRTLLNERLSEKEKNIQLYFICEYHITNSSGGGGEIEIYSCTVY